MPLKVSVGLSKKIGLPDYGSLGASCHVEVELDQSLLASDLDGFHSKVKQAFVACRQAVQDELSRHQDAQPAAGQHNGNGHTNGQRRTQVRKATSSQVRALEAISHKLQLDLAKWLQQRYGLRLASDLTITQASESIDALKAAPKPNGTTRS